MDHETELTVGRCCRRPWLRKGAAVRTDCLGGGRGVRRVVWSCMRAPVGKRLVTGVSGADEAPSRGGSAASRAGGRLARMSGAAVLWAALLVVPAVFSGAAPGEPSGRAVVGPSRASDVSLALQTVVQRAIGGSEQAFSVGRRSGVLVASGGGIASVFARSDVQVRVGAGTVDLRLVGVGYGGRLTLPPGGPGRRWQRGSLSTWGGRRVVSQRAARARARVHPCLATAKRGRTADIGAVARRVVAGTHLERRCGVRLGGRCSADALRRAERG